jgi:signal transduction histidine kinase
VEKLMQNELLKNDINLKLNVASSATRISLDRTLVEQVLINLITNSIHALKDRIDPQISLTVMDEGQHLVIEVSDNGKGISEKELNEIFIPFFSTKKDGSGIGLSLSKQIMSVHGGTIKVKSKPGEGATFYLSFKR